MKKIIIALVLLVASSNALAVTAYWTGRMQQAQSVTYQWGWNCEYNYAGKTFWRMYTGNCPNSVEVY